MQFVSKQLQENNGVNVVCNCVHGLVEYELLDAVIEINVKVSPFTPLILLY